MNYTYFLRFYPYSDVVKYEDEKMEIINDFKGDVLDRTPFIDELIIKEGKSYPGECMKIVKRVEEFFSNHSTNVYYLSRELYKKELSMQSSLL